MAIDNVNTRIKDDGHSAFSLVSSWLCGVPQKRVPKNDGKCAGNGVGILSQRAAIHHHQVRLPVPVSKGLHVHVFSVCGRRSECMTQLSSLAKMDFHTFVLFRVLTCQNKTTPRIQSTTTNTSQRASVVERGRSIPFSFIHVGEVPSSHARSLHCTHFFPRPFFVSILFSLTFSFSLPF